MKKTNQLTSHVIQHYRAHLLKDIINGSKLILLSTKQRHSPHAQIRLFFGGLFLLSVTLFILYVSANIIKVSGQIKMQH